MKQKQVLPALATGTFLTLLGLIGLRHVSYVEAVPGLGIFLGVVAMPGILVEVILEGSLSPQGFHDGQTFAWIVSPANLVIYFMLSQLLIKSFHSRSAKTTQPIDPG
jgi:hypothetical protein